MYKRYFDTISPRDTFQIESKGAKLTSAARRGARRGLRFFPRIAISFFPDSSAFAGNAEKCNARSPSDMKYRLVPTIDLLIIDRSRAVLDIVDARKTDFARSSRGILISSNVAQIYARIAYLFLCIFNSMNLSCLGNYQSLVNPVTLAG